MRRFALGLLLFAACSDDEDLTPLQINQKERDDVVGGMRGTAYRTARNAAPEGTFTVEGRDVSAEDQGLVIATAFLLARQKRLALYEIERTTPQNRAAEYHILRGLVYMAWKWPHPAEQEFRTVQPAEEAKWTRAMSHFGIAAFLLHEKQPDRAAEQIALADDLIGASPLGQVLLAMAAAQQGDDARAKELWGSAADAGGLSPEAKEFLQKHGDKMDLSLIEDHPEIILLLGAASMTDKQTLEPLRPAYEKFKTWCNDTAAKLKSGGE